MKRCPSCQEWVNGKPSTCPTCGHEFNKAYKEELEKRKLVEDIHIPIWRIKDTDPTWLKIAKRPVQLVQLMLYAIVTFFIYISTSLAH